MAIQNYRDCPVTIVIPGFHDLFQLFQVFNERVFHNTINIVYFETYQGGRVKGSKIKRVLHVFPDIIKERRYLKDTWNKYFAELAGCEVFFFSRGFSGFKFYLVKKLSKRNRLVYVSIGSLGPPYWSKYTPTNIVDLASLTISKLIYGRDIAMGKYPHIKGFSYIPDRFIEKEVKRVIDRAEMDEMMKNFDLSQFKVFDVGKYSVIYFDQDLIEVGYVSDGDTFKRELNSIFNILGKYFPENEIALKYHPGYPGDKTMIKIGDVLPDFIAAELLYNEDVKMYLGIFSRSIANVGKGSALSIADLVSFKSDKIRNQLKEMLIQSSKSKILFPESLDEFERIVIDLKEQVKSLEAC